VLVVELVVELTVDAVVLVVLVELEVVVLVVDVVVDVVETANSVESNFHILSPERTYRLPSSATMISPSFRS
jgi:hypothetical protein